MGSTTAVCRLLTSPGAPGDPPAAAPDECRPRLRAAADPALRGIIVGTAGSTLWLRETSDELTRRVFAQAPYSATQLQVYYSAVDNGEVPPTASDEVAAAVSPALDALYAEPRHAVVAPDFAPVVLPRRPGVPAFVAVASMPDLDTLVELVEGRLPRTGDSERRLPPEVAAEYQGPATAAVVEVIVHVDAAIEAELPVGSWIEQSSLRYNPDPSLPALVRVVGTYRAADPHPSPLDDVANARRPAISVEPEGNLVRTTALAADEETVLRAGWTGQPDVLFTFDPLGTPSSAQSDLLVAETRQLRLQAWPPVLAADDVGAQTGVGEIASAVATSRDTSNATAMLTLTSVAAAALVVLLAAAVVLAARRESMTGVMRARGASYRWLVAQRGAEALLIVLPGAAIALAMSAVISGGTPQRDDLLAAGAAALLCAVLITSAQTVPRGIGGERFQGVIRDALQLVLVTLAGTVTAVVLRRESLGSLDPLTLVMAPLVGAAGGVLVMRVLQVVARAAATHHPAQPERRTDRGPEPDGHPEPAGRRRVRRCGAGGVVGGARGGGRRHAPRQRRAERLGTGRRRRGGERRGPQRPDRRAGRGGDRGRLGRCRVRRRQRLGRHPGRGRRACG